MYYDEILQDVCFPDKRFIIMTAENRVAIKNLKNIFQDRFIDTGISEQSLIGTAAGLALRGRKPVVHALAAFLTMRAFEFIRTDIGYGNLPVKLVGYLPGFLSEANGPTHQAVEDISLMRGIPNMNIFCPADSEDLAICLKEILRSEMPFYIRYNSSVPCIEHTNNFQIGKAEVISKGKDINILSYGFLLKECLIAKRLLENNGYSVGVINLRTLKPIDELLLADISRNSQLIVTIEDHFLVGGLFSILGELFLKNDLNCKVMPVALEGKWFKAALMEDLLEYEGFSGEIIAEKINNTFKGIRINAK